MIIIMSPGPPACMTGVITVISTGVGSLVTNSINFSHNDRAFR